MRLAALQDLFARVREKATGHWKVENGGTRTLFLDAGDIVFASSTHAEDRITTLLVEKGRLTQAQLDYALANLKPGISVGRNLMDMGFISQRDLLEVARLQVDKVVQGGLASDIRPVFESRELDRQTVRLPLDTSQLLLGGMLALRDRESILEIMGPLNQVVLLEGRRHQELTLPSDLTRLPGLLDGTRTLLELSREVAVEPVRLGAFVVFLREMGWARLHELPPVDRTSMGLALEEGTVPLSPPLPEAAPAAPSPSLFSTIQAAERPTTNLEHLSHALDEIEAIQNRLVPLSQRRPEGEGAPVDTVPLDTVPAPLSEDLMAAMPAPVEPLAPVAATSGEAVILTEAGLPEVPEELEAPVMPDLMAPLPEPQASEAPEPEVPWMPAAVAGEAHVEPVLRVSPPEGGLVAPEDPLQEELSHQGHGLRWFLVICLVAAAGVAGYRYLKGRQAERPAPTPAPRVEPPKAEAPKPEPPKAAESPAIPESTPAPVSEPAPAKASEAAPAKASAPTREALQQAADQIRKGDLTKAQVQGLALVKAKPDSWAVQVMVGCQPDTIRKVPDLLPKRHRDVFVLPMAMKDKRACYKVFMGPFADKATAEAARDELSTDFGKSRPRGLVFQLREIALSQ